MVQPIFHFVRGFTKGVTNRGGREEGRLSGRRAGALQEFTRGPVHEHVKVGPGAHRWLPSRMSGTYVNSYARVRVIYVYTKRRRGPWSLPKSDVGTRCVPRSALKPTITFFGSRSSAIPPLRERYIYDSGNAIQGRNPRFRHFFLINIF